MKTKMKTLLHYFDLIIASVMMVTVTLMIAIPSKFDLLRTIADGLVITFLIFSIAIPELIKLVNKRYITTKHSWTKQKENPQNEK